MSLSLKIDNQFIALPDSTEISIEASNPIFSDAGAKTYLFEVPVESLRYIIGNADEIYGESLYDVLEGKRTEIYIDGVQFFSGVVNLEDEISIEDGKIAVSIASGNLEFAQMIEGMNCRDVEQAEDIVVGKKYVKIEAYQKLNKFYSVTSGDAKNEYTTWFELPDEFTSVTRNVDAAYPVCKYCTIRIAASSTSSNNLKRFIGEYGDGAKYGSIENKVSNLKDHLYVLEAGRRNSGICFYINYFTDCLFHTLGIVETENALKHIEDFNRIALVNMRCKTASPSENSNLSSVSFDSFKNDIRGVYLYSGGVVYDTTGKAYYENAIASSENFPDKDVSDVIDSLQNGFGVRFIHDSKQSTISVMLIRDILKCNDVKNISCRIHSAVKVENSLKGFVLTYNSGDNDSNYTLPKVLANVKKESYSDILEIISPYDKKMYVDERNGNSYVIKVHSEETEGNEKELFPSLFEVGGFTDANYGDCRDENHIEKISIPFSPIINNDVIGDEAVDKAKNGAEDSTIEQVYALLIDGEIEPKEKVYGVNLSGTSTFTDTAGTSSSGVAHVGFRYVDYLGSQSDVSWDTNWHPAEEETTANSFDTGLMLGIMRGPGSSSKLDAYSRDYDGEGNYKVAFTAANYAFTSDSIDHCNRVFDYNGTGSGGADLNGRISLKIRADKYDKDGNPIKDADGTSIVVQDKTRAERGLYDTFWKEYAYFTVNKKILRITCGMEIADIINLDWTKRYKIGEWTGFIANYSFNVNKNGMSEVELELYYI